MTKRFILAFLFEIIFSAATFSPQVDVPITMTSISSSCSPQYPSLLNGKIARPSWAVVGVDSAAPCAGNVPGQSFTNITVSQPAGTTYNAGSHTLSCTADNAVIDGYDFTGNSGVQIFCANNNLTIKNNKFGGTNNAAVTVAPLSFTGVNYTITNNNIDGGCVRVGGTGAGGAQSSLLNFSNNDAGTVAIQNNWFTNYCQHIVELGHGVDLLNYDHNLIDTFGGWWPCAAPNCPHMNWLQLGGNPGTYGVMNVNYNTVYQHTLGGSEGWQFYPNFTPASMPGPVTVNNNTIVTVPSGGQATASNIMHGDGCAVDNDAFTMNNNYFDLSGTLVGAFASFARTCWASSTTNINMQTGSVITFPP